MMDDGNVGLTVPKEFYGLIISLRQTVEQNTKEVRELTAMMRGDGMNSGFVIEHERIKNKIAYDSQRSVDDRLCEIERIVGAGKWLVLVLLGTAVLNLATFLWDLITHQASIVHP